MNKPGSKTNANKNTAVQLTRTERLITYLIKHQKNVVAVTTLITVIIVGVLGWYVYQTQQNKQAQNDMYQAIYAFEAGDYDQACNGGETYMGFKAIINTYPYTKAAKLAQLYMGLCYMQQNKYDEALPHLKQATPKDYLVQARIWSLMGDAYTQKQDYDQACTYYIKAAEHHPNEFFTPIYLHKAALAYEAKQSYQAAIKCYEQIIQDYPQSSWYDEACKHKGRLSATNQKAS